MINLLHTFVKDLKGMNIGVFLPLGDYKKIVRLREDYEDTFAFDKAIKHKDNTVPFRDAVIL